MKKFHLAFLALMLSIFASEAAVRLPSVIADGMVIQRNEPVKIWGWADSGEEVTVSWKKEKVTTTADESGRWIVTLSPSKAGGPYTMTIGNTTINDILVGDVFLCSGQSNMELPVARVMDMFAQEVLSYENTQIRQLQIPEEDAVEIIVIVLTGVCQQGIEILTAFVDYRCQTDDLRPGSYND